MAIGLKNNTNDSTPAKAAFPPMLDPETALKNAMMQNDPANFTKPTTATGDTQAADPRPDTQPGDDFDDSAERLDSLVQSKTAQQPPQDQEAPKLDASALLPYIGGLDLDELKRLDKKAGKGIDLKLHFYRKNPAARNFILSQNPLRFKGVIIAAARTGGGKTLFLSSLAAHILNTKKDHHVVFVSLEESKSRTSKRILAAYMYAHENVTPSEIISLDTIEKYIQGERIQSQEEIDDAIRHGKTPDDGRIINAFTEIADRLTVIDIESLIESRERFIKAQTNLETAATLSESWKADQSTTIKALIEAYREKYQDKVVFFVDYAQRIHNDDDQGKRRNGASYKEIQAVMSDFISCGRNGAVIFIAAQMNRDNPKETKGDPAAELWNAIPEQLREAADIEQAADMIFYLKLNTTGNPPQTFLNMRVMKYRDGESEQAAAIPIRWSVRSGNFSKLAPPTLLPSGAESSDASQPSQPLDWDGNTTNDTPAANIDLAGIQAAMKSKKRRQ